MIDEYIKARKAGEREYKERLSQGEYPFLPALDDILQNNNSLPTYHLGLMEIPTGLIAGTKTRARQNSFAPGFMPLLGPDTEFAMKWSNLYIAQMTEGFSDPIRVYEYLHQFYVVEGNKRVSVSRFLDMPTIMADVTRIIPTVDTLRANPAYAEFLKFYKVCPIYDIVCSDPGAYEEIAELLGQKLGSAGPAGASQSSELWPDDLIKSLRAAYWQFSQAYNAGMDKMTDVTAGDAFLVYLRVYVKDALSATNVKELEKRLKKIRKEFLIAGNEEKIALVESADSKGSLNSVTDAIAMTTEAVTGAVSKILPGTYSLRHPLKAAFVFDKEPENSNWIYNHEAGRRRLETEYGGVVRTAGFISAQGNEAAIKEAVKWGADVVFTTSVKMIDDTLRAAIEYEDVIFLNCSINLAHQDVRTYYSKLYEAKFLAGIVAGAAAASDGSHRIGYCSDYPIYGTIASINAFAIGAAMADPMVKIELEWSSRKDNNWWWSMVDRGIHVISAIDSTHNTDGSNAYGVCYVEKCEPGEGTDLSGLCRVQNLAAPIWKWGKLYEIIIKSIMDGTYNTRYTNRKDQATNYWWGMISGVVDVELSDAISPYTRQLVEILRSDIISGTMNPFDGELRSQEGLVRRAEDAPLTSMEVITMDWLNENIIGEIPKTESLTDIAKDTVKVSGVKN